jgi:hypothetical protein
MLTLFQVSLISYIYVALIDDQTDNVFTRSEIRVPAVFQTLRMGCMSDARQRSGYVAIYY